MNSENVDPTRLVDDLLRGTNDWKGVQEIVRLTMRALVETVKAQGAAIRDLERGAANKVGRSELYSMLGQKADYTEISEQISELRSYLENRSILAELQSELGDKVSHDELRYYMDLKPSLKDVQSLGDSLTQARNSMLDLNSRVESLQTDFNAHTKTTSLLIDDLTKDSNAKEDSLNHLDLKFMQKCTEQSSSLQKEIYDLKDSLSEKIRERVEYSEFNDKYLPLIMQKAEQTEVDSFYATAREIKKDLKKITDDFRKNIANCSSKKETEDLKDSMLLQISTKADYKESEKILNLLSKKADQLFIEEMLNHHKQVVEDNFNDRTKQLEDIVNSHKQNIKKSISELEKGFESHSKSVLSTVDTLQTQQKSSQVAFEKDTSNLLLQVNDILETLEKTALKEDVQQIETKIDFTHETQMKSTDENSQEILKLVASIQQDFAENLSSLESDIKDALLTKANNTDIEAWLYAKVDKETFSIVHQAITSLKHDVERIFVDIERRASLPEFEKHVKSTRKALQDVSKDMLLKANIKDLCGVLDSKASIEDVNSTLIDLHKELDGKANKAELREHLSEQTLINEALCTENTLGRWIWKSGELKTGSVPWDIQTVNTCPDNFVWDAEISFIEVVTPGLYEISFGFYSRKKPKVQLLVNGDPVLSAVNNASYVIHHSSGRLLNTGTHPSGNISGLTLIDFLALPSRAKIAISYAGETKAEGFLSLRKL